MSSSVKLPNIRKLFKPDKGKILLDCDLSGADAQVVAWEADDQDLKNAFRNGLNIHNHNGKTMWGDAYQVTGKRPGAKYGMRDEIKRGVHAANYGVSARTLAITLGWKIADAERFISTWFSHHRPIPEWHRRTDFLLQTTRTISNRFGYRIIFFDRPEALLPTALAWTPQSTVGLVCSRGGVQLRRNLPWVEMLLQVHDSVVFQIPYHRFEPGSLEEIKRHLTVPIPYPDPLYIPWEMAASEISWGDCTKRKWTGEPK